EPGTGVLVGRDADDQATRGRNAGAVDELYVVNLPPPGPGALEAEPDESTGVPAGRVERYLFDGRSAPAGGLVPCVGPRGTAVDRRVDVDHVAIAESPPVAVEPQHRRA